MGGGGSVSNNTPYDWVFDRGRQVSTDVCTLRRNSTKEYSEEFIYNHQLWFRFEDHSNWDLKCWGRGDSFTIRESSDRKYFELVNNSSRQVVDKCPHFGRIEEEKQERKRREREEKRRRKEEEKRRQAELERMRRIQEEMEERKRQERIQKEEQRRREEEEKRRQEKLERMRRIQEQIEERRRQEEQRRREEEEKRRQETLERMRRIQKEIEERRRQEEQQRREEEEKRRQETLERMRRIQEEIEERKRQERIQKEEQRRREEEEKRRQAEQERMRRIQEHIEIKRKHLERREQEVQQRERLDRMRIQMQMQKESEASRRKLSAAQKRLQMQPLTQTLTLTLTLQQQALVLLQPLEDHSAHTHRDQVGEVKEQFEELLSAYQITENEGVETDLEDRMKTLQNELTLRYFRQHNIPIWPQWALDQATGYVELSLTEKISVLEAVLKATLGAEPESQEGPDKKVAFLLRLQDQLHTRNPTLARKVLVNVLDLTSQLPKASKEILSRILFNNVWTPKEIRLFMGSARGTDPHRVTQVLHSACTHRLSCLRALAALRDTDPVGHIQAWASRQEDKDAAAIVAEMQDKNCPPHILSLLEALLTHVEEELPRHTTARMSPERAREWRRGVASLDLADPNPAALREVLVGLCIAVKTCTAFTASGGEPVPGYFPRLTQMAALVLLLLPQVQDRKGCLLEMGTGEGKTCLLAMFATVQAARGAAVDVVTSSPLLAIRDQQEWEGLYRLLGVTSSPVPPPRLDGGSFGQQDELLQEAYRQQVVYGTAGTFAADILRQEFEKKTTRGRRGFECVVVDEVDYMTLDSGVQVTFLSHQASSLRHLEQVLSGVWALLSACRPLELLEPGELRWAARIQPFHSTLKQAGIGPQAWSEHDILALGVRLGLYPQEDLDQLQEAQGLYPQEDLDRLQEAQDLGLYPQEDLDQLQEAQGLYPQEDLDQLQEAQSQGLYPQEDLDQLKKAQSQGLYPQEDLDQLQEAQGLYPQEDLDQLQEAQGLYPQEDLDQLQEAQDLGLYPQEDLDQLQEAQGLYPQEDLDQLQEAQGLYPQEDLDQLQEALGLYPQEDLDQLQEAQGLYPQEDLDQLQEAQGLYPQEDLDQLKKTQSLGLYPQEDLDQLKKTQSLGLYPQEDLDQLKKTQGLYPQEDLDQLQEAQDLGLYPQEDLDQLQEAQGLYPQEDLDRLQEAQGLYPQEDLDHLKKAQDLGLYPQEDLDQLKKAQSQGLYPQEDLDQLQEAQGLYPQEDLDQLKKTQSLGLYPQEDLDQLKKAQSQGLYPQEDLDQLKKTQSLGLYPQEDLDQLKKTQSQGLYPQEDLDQLKKAQSQGLYPQEDLDQLQEAQGLYPQEDLDQLQEAQGLYPQEDLDHLKKAQGLGLYPQEDLDHLKKAQSQALYPQEDLDHLEKAQSQALYPQEDLDQLQEAQGLGLYPQEDLDQLQEAQGLYPQEDLDQLQEAQGLYPQEDLDQLKKTQSLGLYPQEDLDQLQEAQGLYPQEDLDQLKKAQSLGLYPQEDLDQLKKTQSLGLYPQEDLDQLQEAQGLYPQEDLDRLQEAQGLYPQEDLDQLQEAQGLYPQEDLDQLQEAQSLGLYPQEDLDQLKKTQSQDLYPQEDLDQLKKTQSQGLYPQEDLDQLKKAQGLYPQEDLDQLQEAQGLYPQEDLDQLQEAQSLGLYPQEDLDQLKKTQSQDLYPQEDLDQLKKTQSQGLYPQEDLDQLKKAQGLYPQEDLDQLQEAQDLGLYPQEDLDQLKKTQSLGLYPQEDLDKLKKTQGLYPQEDLDQLQEAQGLYPQEDLDRLQEAQSLGLYPQEDLDQLQEAQGLGLYPQEDLDQLKKAQGLYPQEDLDQLKKAQSLYPQEDLDQLQEALGLYPQEDLDHLEKAQPDNEDKKQKASENIAARMGPGEQLRLLAALQDAAESRASVACYSLSSSRAKLLRGGGAPGDPDLSLLLLHNGRACEFMSEKSLIEATVAKLRSRIKFSGECSLQSKTDCEGFIVIPSFLKEYVQQQLAVFAENALKAILMTPGREYMIDKAAEADGAGSESHQYDAIVPVDFQASGVLERNKRWGGGLQQFLEMKHQLAISPLSNVTNYMSNVHFFRRYLGGRGIFGVSGTLGGPAEKAFLERQYQTACCSIPAHRQKKLLELPALQAAGGQAAWTQAVCGAAWRAADRGQAVLVICEDVKTAERLRAEMQSPGRKPRPITMYTISAKHNIEKQTFGQGHVIIATNLGGRGTDVHVEQEVNERGGLFVLLTYFPGSHRVERQVFGRTARKGNPGMVQMVLNQDHLAAAYRGQSVETMRQLREEFEVSRLHGMERNELSHVQTKEELFSTFCTFLRDFDKNYTQEERSDISEMKLKDVPACFKVRCRKLDYQAALNALKGSWALWLILHEEHIGQRPVTALRDGLLRDLERTAEQLLQGSSSSFYDYIEVAKSRTDMHRLDKEKSDYGALSYWQSAAESDPFYRAVALYNQAYITVNLRQSDYIPEAKRLLREADSAVDAYLSEASNTMMFCNFSVSKDFAPHHEDGNLQRQMKARMSVFRAWKGYIESALETLQKIESSKGQAITEESSVYGLSGDQDPVTTKELMVLHEFGLSTVFQVKKKPEFSIDALLCFCLGVLQVAAGVLVCTLSSGSASQFGLALINDGVSDMIQGVKGMIQGSFDWAEWAISKAISIGVSLAFGGLSRLRSAARAVGGGARGLATGAQTCSAFTVKQCFKHAAKYAGQEMVKQVCVTTLNYVADKGLEALFKKVLREAFRTKVLSLIRANGPLDSRLTGLVCSGVPKTALELQSGGFRMDGGCEGEIRKSVEIMTRSIIPELMTDCTKIMKVVDRLSEVCGAIMQHVENDGLKLAMKCLDTTKYIILCKQIQDSFPSEDVINKNFVPRLLEAMSVLPNEEDPSDGRRRLADVKRLKDQLLGVVAESVSDSLVEACSRHMTSFMTKACVHKISSAAGGAVSNLLGRTDTHSFFHNQVHKHRLQEAARGPGRPPAEQQDLQRLAEAIGDQHRPATELDLYLLTQSPALQGRGLRLTVVDEHGRALTEDYYPGTDSSADDIELRLKRYPEAPQQTQGFLYNLTERARGEQPPHQGHFELVGADGAVVPAYSEGQNCLYHAVAQATRGGAADLRAQVQRTLLQDLPRWAPALRLQRGYQQTLAASSRYAISGGARRERDQISEAYQQMLDRVRIHHPLLHPVMDAYKLGLVGTYQDVRGVRRGGGAPGGGVGGSGPNADHIPPRDSLRRAWEALRRGGAGGAGGAEAFRAQNPALHRLLQDPKLQLCREVLQHHHQLCLTTGNSREARSAREHLSQVLLSGDSLKLMKASLLLSNPEVSESLRRDAGLGRRQTPRLDYLSGAEVRAYHRVGERLLVDGYAASGVLSPPQREELLEWLEGGQLYSPQTAEYQQLLHLVRNANKKAPIHKKKNTCITM